MAGWLTGSCASHATNPCGLWTVGTATGTVGRQVQRLIAESCVVVSGVLWLVTCMSPPHRRSWQAGRGVAGRSRAKCGESGALCLNAWSVSTHRVPLQPSGRASAAVRPAWFRGRARAPSSLGPRVRRRFTGCLVTRVCVPSARIAATSAGWSSTEQGAGTTKASSLCWTIAYMVSRALSALVASAPCKQAPPRSTLLACVGCAGPTCSQVLPCGSTLLRA